MNLKKELRFFILPAIKGLPLWVALMVLGYLIANRSLQQTVPIYEVGAKVKLDNREHGVNDYELFNDGAAARSGSNFLTEVEIFKTKGIQLKALEKLDFDVSYYRVTDVRQHDIYKENPFIIDYKILDSISLDEDIYLKYAGNGKFRFYKDREYTQYSHTLRFNKAYTDSTTISYRIRRNNVFLKKNPSDLQVGDRFIFKINNLKTLVKGIDNSNFFVMPVDKEVYIVKLHYKHEHPQKAADFLNTLIETYIENNRVQQNRKTSKILAFIEGELDNLGTEMQGASRKLSDYRRSNNIINPLQETETILKKLSQYDMTKLSLDIKEIELKNIFSFLKSDQKLSGFSPDFELVKDDVFQYTFMDLKKLEIEKYQLAEKYPESSQEMQTINSQINVLKDFVLSSIEKKLINIREQKSEIVRSIQETQNIFETYPDKERSLAKLERDFQLKEETFNYLNKKKLELDIANSADHSLHEIIDYATVPKRPSSPNYALITGVTVFAFMIIGLALVYALNFFFRTVSSVYELKENLTYPVIAKVPRNKSMATNNRESLLNLYSNFLNLGAFEGSKMISISSLADNEGKTFITKELGSLLADYGKRVLLIDLNFRAAEVNKETEDHSLSIFEKPLIFLDELWSTLKHFLGRYYWTKKLLWMLGYRGKSLQDLALKPVQQSKNLDYVFLAGEDQALTSTQLFSPSTKHFLQEIKSNYDVVLIDTDCISKKIDAAATMMISDFNFFIFRRGVSRVRHINKCQQFVEAYNLDNIYLVLNDTK